MKRTTACLLAGFLLLNAGTALSQEKGKGAAKPKDPFVKDPNNGKEEGKIDYEIGILLEYIVVDHHFANRVIREWAPRASDVGELRDQLDEMIEKEEADLMETVWVLARSGQRAKTESIRETIYASEYDPAEIPNNVGAVSSVEAKDKKNQAEADRQAAIVNQNSSGVASNVPFTNPNPTAFEVRNVGTTLEVDPVLETDNRTINLNIAPEIVERLEDEQMAREGYEGTARGLEHVRMPTFYTIKDTTQMTTIDGSYHLLGIHRPHDDESKRILVILRADVIAVK